MRIVLAKFMGSVAELGEKLILQVAVSVAATVCVAAISNSYLSGGAKDASAVPQELSSLASQSVTNLLNANFAPDGFRSRTGSTDDFAAVFGPNEDGAFTPPVAREWSTEISNAGVKADKPIQVKARQIVAAMEESSHLPETSILPPARSAAISPAELTQAALSTTEASSDRQVQLLGISLPSLAPAAERVLTTVTSWSGAVVDLVLR
jgi:hypothetical protein